MSSINAANHEKGQRNSLYRKFDFSEEVLNQPGVFILISVTSNSPLKEPHGARQVVSFLESLPYPSIVVIVDSNNKHNVMAIKGVESKGKMCVDEAREIALKHGDAFVAAISNAIQERENVAQTNKVSVIRWDEIIDENKKQQQDITRKHYEMNQAFRERVDEVASNYLNQRTPNSKYYSQRLSHAAKFILGEVPVFVTGVSHKGKRYQTHIYATSTLSLANEKSNPDVRKLQELMNDIRTDPVFADLKEELVEADDGMEASKGEAILPVSLKHEIC